MSNAPDNISKRFMSGLRKYNLTFADLQRDWYYAGGEQGKHLNYYKKLTCLSTLPRHLNHCVCGHHIKHNCYVTNGTQVLVMGNCCVARFVKPKPESLCEKCGCKHRNRKNNICSDCRKNVTIKYLNTTIVFD